MFAKNHLPSLHSSRLFIIISWLKYDGLDKTLFSKKLLMAKFYIAFNLKRSHLIIWMASHHPKLAPVCACASSFIGQQTCRACALGNCAEEVNRGADRPAGVAPTRLGWKLREALRRRGRAGSKLVRRKGPAGPGREVASLTLTSSSSSRLSDRELRLTCALNRS